MQRRSLLLSGSAALAALTLAACGKRSEKPIASYLSLAACCSQWLRMNKKNKK